jgi:uracil-DNA glycosylase family 4
MSSPLPVRSAPALPSAGTEPRDESPGEARHAEIVALHERILACRACQEACYIPAARPVRHPWTPAQRTMIVGQAPGAQTEAKRYHFAGPGGRVLESWFVTAGFPGEAWRERCYITSLTRCFPGKSPRGKGDRKPSPAELALCRPFLDAELALVRPRLIVPVGTMAIELFLGKRPLDGVVGSLFEHEDALVLPFPHPSPVSRWLNDPAHQALVDRAVGLLGRCREELEL